MSTVEGFDLHVYCDTPSCRASDAFGGHDKREAFARAKASGRRMSRKDAPEGSVAGGRAALCRRCAEGNGP
jgi:hypothetical protein